MWDVKFITFTYDKSFLEVDGGNVTDLHPNSCSHSHSSIIVLEADQIIFSEAQAKRGRINVLLDVLKTFKTLMVGEG